MDSQLGHLKEQITSITAIVDYSLETLYFACDQNFTLSSLQSKIDENKKTVHEQCLMVEKLAFDILQTSSPRNKDLRFVVASMRIVRDFKRVSSHIQTISNGLKNVDVQELLLIKEMLSGASFMLRTAIDAFVLERLDLAEETISNDSVLDDCNNRIIKSFLRKDESLKHIKNGYYSTKVAKSLERIGDYIKNIAEEVIFIDEGYGLTFTHTYTKGNVGEQETHTFS